MKKSNTNLCDLPDVLLSLTIEKLEKQSNALCLRAACTKFQSLIPSPSTLPIRKALIIPLPFASSSDKPTHFSIVESKVFALQPRNEVATPTSWFLKVQESNSGDQVRLMDPLTRLGFENASVNLPKCLNMFDYEVKELAQSYELEGLDKHNNKVGLDNHHHVVFSNQTEETCFTVEKVVVSDEFDVMVMHNKGKVSVWRKGDKNWTSIHLGTCEDSFEDIIFYKKKFYVTDYRGVTLYVDCKTLTVRLAATPLRGLNDGLNYLVKSDKDLFLLVKCWIRLYLCRDNEPYLKLHPAGFQVLKLDEERNTWVDLMNKCEDRVFFVGESCCFSIGVDEFCGFKKNCVYFSDSAFASSDEDAYPGWSSAVFDFDDFGIRRFSKFPSLSHIFWSPPAWLKQDSTSS